MKQASKFTPGTMLIVLGVLLAVPVGRFPHLHDLVHLVAGRRQRPEAALSEVLAGGGRSARIRIPPFQGSCGCMEPP